MSDERKPLEPSEALLKELRLAQRDCYPEEVFALIRDYVLEEAAKVADKDSATQEWTAETIRAMKGKL